MVEKSSSKRLCHLHGGHAERRMKHFLAARFEVTWEMFSSL
jgi:hypothetical protein